MRRRTYLASISSALLAGSSGCLGLFSSKPDIHFDKPITNVEFDTNYSSNSPFAGNPPVVTFHPRIWTVEIIGTIPIGSEACRKAAIARLAYEDTTNRLEVVITNTEEPGAGPSCSAEMARITYRVSISFDETLPNEVYVIEDGRYEARQTTLARRRYPPNPSSNRNVPSR